MRDFFDTLHQNTCGNIFPQLSLPGCFYNREIRLKMIFFLLFKDFLVILVPAMAIFRCHNYFFLKKMAKKYFYYGSTIFWFPVDPGELPVSSEFSSLRCVQKRQNRAKKGGTTKFCRHTQNTIFGAMGGHFLGENIFQKLFSSFLTRKTRRAASKSVSKLKNWFGQCGPTITLSSP